MTIYINGKFLCQQTTGTQIYALSMLKAMRSQKLSFHLLVPASAKVPPEYAYTRVGWFSHLALWEQLSLPWFLGFKKDALLINFCNSAPFFISKQIITIHDLAFEQRGVNWFSKRFLIWYRFLIPKLCRKARHIFTVSQFSKSELCRHYQIPEQTISIVSNVFVSLNEIAERQIQEDYLLVLGAQNPRKNAAYVLKHIHEIKKRGYKLVFVYSDAENFEQNESWSDPALIQLSYVTDAVYYSLIRHAKALIYPSLYEGFGVPVLQSLCMGTPVICFKLKVFSDCFGELPIFINDNKPQAFSEALNQLELRHITKEDIDRLQQKYSLEHSGTQIINSLHSL